MAIHDKNACGELVDELLFENTYKEDKASYREVMKHLIFGQPRYIGIGIFFACAFAYLLFYALVLGNPNEEIWNYGIVIIVGSWLFCNVLLLINYFRSVKLGAARNKEIYGEEAVSLTKRVARGEGIRIMLINPRSTDLEYRERKIRKVRQTKNYFCLYSDTKLVYLFKKGAFTVGTDDEFRAYLRSKGYKVK